MRCINLFSILACMIGFATFSTGASATVEVEGFIEGTLVKTPEGYSKIETLLVGDLVMSCDFEGSCVERQVLKTSKKEASRYLEIEVDGQKIGVGYSHKLFSCDTDFWTNATNIKNSSSLMNALHRNVSVSNVGVIRETVTLYNLSIEQFQNYFVSMADVLVHNYAAQELDAMLDAMSPRDRAQILIMESAKRYGLHSPPQLSYILATAEHETMNFKTMKEIGGSKMPYAPYYGRGYVQLTHKFNYEKFSKLFGEDIVSNPDRAMDPRYASDVIVFGMMMGVFTGELKKDGKNWSGKKLIDYIVGNGDGTGKADFVNARRIINSLDRAEHIAGLAKKWLQYFKNTRGTPNGDIKFLQWMPWHNEL